MGLLGGFNPAPVPPEKVLKAKNAFRSFNEQTLAKKYPCRYIELITLSDSSLLLDLDLAFLFHFLLNWMERH